jgi:hypothetical protein
MCLALSFIRSTLDGVWHGNIVANSGLGLDVCPFGEVDSYIVPYIVELAPGFGLFASCRRCSSLITSDNAAVISVAAAFVLLQTVHAGLRGRCARMFCRVFL